jgi:hypothetical protein
VPISTYLIPPPPISLCVCMCIPLSSLHSGSVERYRCNEYIRNIGRIVRGGVSYAICMVSKESRLLVSPRTSFLLIFWTLSKFQFLYKATASRKTCFISYIKSRQLVKDTTNFPNLLLYTTKLDVVQHENNKFDVLRSYQVRSGLAYIWISRRFCLLHCLKSLPFQSTETLSDS